MSNSGYKNFSDYYDIYTDIIDYELWAEYIVKLAEKDLTKKNILELGCGSGNLMIEMKYQTDANLYGVDLSEEMLSFADQNAFLEDMKVNLVCSDMSKFKYNENFDLIYCAFDSINYLLNENDMLNTFNNAYDMLNPNSIFTFDIINSENILLNEDIEVDNVLFKIVRTVENGFMYTDLKIYEDGKFMVQENHKQKLYTIDVLRNLFEKSSFDSFEFYDFLTKEPVNKETDKIQIVLKRT